MENDSSGPFRGWGYPFMESAYRVVYRNGSQYSNFVFDTENCKPLYKNKKANKTVGFFMLRY